MRKKLPWNCLLLACLAFLAGCGAGLLGELSRAAADPSPRTPRAVSFAAELEVNVSWDADGGADLYVLERALDALSPVYTEAYRGASTSYTDTQCSDQSRYLYRLSMVRGSRTFGPSDAAMGVGSAACNDSLEPNDGESEAVALEYDRKANLYYYRSFSGTVVRDEDWFSVSVPPRRRAGIVVTQDGLGSGAVDAWMSFYLKGSTPRAITNNDVIYIENTAYEEKTFLFEISPIPEAFIYDSSLGGGALIDYSVSLQIITSL